MYININIMYINIYNVYNIMYFEMYLNTLLKYLYLLVLRKSILYLNTI